MNKVILGDVVERVKDVVDKDNTDLEYYIGGEHFEYGEICISKKAAIKGSTIGPAFHMRFKPGDVLLMSRNPHLRKAGMVDFEGICSDVSYVCRTKDEGVLLQRLLPFIFQTDDFWDFAEANKKGSTNFFLNWSDFAKYELLLPDIDKQEQLAETLWTIQNTLEAEKKALAAAQDLRNSFYAFSQDEQFFIDNHYSYRISTIGDDYEICNSFRKPISQANRSQMQGPYPYWGPTSILDHLNEYRLDGEYVLIGEDGDHFLKYADWDMTHLVDGKFNVNNHAHIIKEKGSNLLKWFFYYFKHRDIERFLTKQGGGRLKLTKAKLITLPILIPDAKVQEELCEKYDAVESVIDAHKNNIEKTKEVLRDVTECSLSL